MRSFGSLHEASILSVLWLSKEIGRYLAAISPPLALVARPAKVSHRSCVRQVQQIGHGDGGWFAQVNNNILLFDRQEHPFVPTCLPAEHRAQRQSRESANLGLFRLVGFHVSALKHGNAG
jgi:hypothetical protein